MTITKTRMRLCTVLILLNLAFIWGNSALPGEISGMLSDFVKDLLQNIFHIQPSDSGAESFLVRKLAHFSEFATLGILLSWFLCMKAAALKIKAVYALLFGCLAAFIDEGIQLFSPGRCASLKDVIIDTAGVTVGIAVLFTSHACCCAVCRKRQQTTGV